jgi:hypothetical protein
VEERVFLLMTWTGNCLCSLQVAEETRCCGFEKRSLRVRSRSGRGWFVEEELLVQGEERLRLLLGKAIRGTCESFCCSGY